MYLDLERVSDMDKIGKYSLFLLPYVLHGWVGGAEMLDYPGSRMSSDLT